MAKTSKYVSKKPNENGLIEWTPEENKIWQELYQRQIKSIEGKACDEFMTGLNKLNLSQDRIPQLKEVSDVLMAETGWQCYSVPALIGFGEFFKLLSERKFPVATFIRTREEFDYLQEPDIFHEIFGHCPLLTNKSFADYTQAYGMLGLNATKEERVALARMYWFTVEFGLLDTADGLRIYGGGILSSPGETEYAINSEDTKRKPFEIMDVLRTPYRIDIMQPIYYLLNQVSDLDKIRENSVEQMLAYVKQAKELGLFPPRFEPKEKVAS